MWKIQSKIKYPKLMLLVFSFIAAYIIFRFGNIPQFHETLASFGYIGTFLSGLFFVYGFTAAPATAVLLILAKEQHILLAGIIGGFGALIGDFIIFRYIRHSMINEIEMLKQKIFFTFKPPSFIKKYIVPFLAGLIVASPLPDEIGVSMFALSKIISTKKFAIISYLLNTAGIFAILLIGNSI